MKLFYKLSGEGDKPLIILHGLFGMSDNWTSMARSFAENGFSVYNTDLRNHGRSFHSDEFSYEVMANDVYSLINSLELSKVNVIGHSMGGKVAMFLAGLYPTLVEKMIIVDIAPKYYPPHHQTVLSAIRAVDTSQIQSRKDAEASLKNVLHDESTIQFLLKNLYWKSEDKLDWRFDALNIENKIEEVGKALPEDFKITCPVLFVAGEKSGYITRDDEVLIQQQFSDVRFEVIKGAGHWVHAANPQDFLEACLRFLE